MLDAGRRPGAAHQRTARSADGRARLAAALQRRILAVAARGDRAAAGAQTCSSSVLAAASWSKACRRRAARLDVIELEPKVIEANRATRALRKRDPLADPRVNLIVNDARGALRLTARRYDAIVSQPSHPWTAGASHLYTREFMQLAHEHLTRRRRVRAVDERDLHGRGPAAFADRHAAAACSEVRVYRPDPNTSFSSPATRRSISSCRSRATRPAAARCAAALRAVRHQHRRGPGRRAGARRRGRAPLRRRRPLITDDDNRIATSSVFERGRGLTATPAAALLAANDPLQRRDSLVYTEMREQLSFPYIARRNGVFVLLDPSLLDRLGHMSQHPGSLARTANMCALSTTARAAKDNARPSACDSRSANIPIDEPLRQELLRGWFSALVHEKPPAEIAEIAGGLKSAYSQSVLDAARFAAKSDWQGVASTDSRLAEIPWTDGWYPEAVELRINWRIRVTIPRRRRASRNRRSRSSIARRS